MRHLAYLLPLILLSAPILAQDSANISAILQRAHSYVTQPGEKAEDLDSALLFIRRAEDMNRHAKNQTLAAEALYVRSTALREKGDTAAGHAAIDKAITMLKAAGTMRNRAEAEGSGNMTVGANGNLATTGAGELLGEAYAEQANYYPTSTDAGLQSHKECLINAARAFGLSGAKKREGDILKDLGDINYLLRNFGEALNNLNKALGLYKAANFRETQGVYDLLSIVSTNMADYSDAVKYGRLAATTAEEVHDSSLQLCTIYNRLAVAYSNWDKWDEAIAYDKKALAVAIKYRDQDAIQTVLFNYCYSLTPGNEWQQAIQLIAQCRRLLPHFTLQDSIDYTMFPLLAYRAGKRFDSADIFANHLITLLPRAEKAGLFMLPYYGTLARYYLSAHKFPLAEKYAKLNLASTISSGNKRASALAYREISRADSGLGNYHSALANYIRFKEISDSLLDETQTFLFAQMQAAYESEKKDRELELRNRDIQLLTNKSLLQEATLKKGVMGRNFIVAISMLIVIGLLIGYLFKERKNAQLRVLLDEQKTLAQEKEWLVREIHHRVKNNLQIVISLLNTQSSFLENPSAIHAVRDIKERMQAIALIHQRLYQTDDPGLVRMKTYIEEMTASLSHSFVGLKRVSFDLHIDDILLDVSQAVPLGLILNEAITNAIKHAFPGDRGGRVSIRLTQLEGRYRLLEIEDDGVGMQAGFDWKTASSLGMHLIKLFADQLEAESEIGGRSAHGASSNDGGSVAGLTRNEGSGSADGASSNGGGSVAGLAGSDGSMDGLIRSDGSGSKDGLAFGGASAVGLAGSDGSTDGRAFSGGSVAGLEGSDGSGSTDGRAFGGASEGASGGVRIAIKFMAAPEMGTAINKV